MNRSVIIVATAIVIVIAGLIIFIKPWDGDVEVVNDDDDDVVLPPLPPVGPGADDDDDDVVFPPPPPPPPIELVQVSINAIPWARVFIKLPENDYFMEPRPRDFTIPPEPNGKNANVTPIPGDLKVPIGTAIKLMYRGKEKIFPYEVWKDGKTISHDFLNQ